MIKLIKFQKGYISDCLLTNKFKVYSLYFNLELIKMLSYKIMRNCGFDNCIPKKISHLMDLEMITNNGLYIKNIKDQDTDLSLIAVKQNGLALEFVKEQSEEICLAAVRQNGKALKFVKHQTCENCIEAVKENALAIVYVKEQTEDMCLISIKRYYEMLTESSYNEDDEFNGSIDIFNEEHILNYIENKTEKICLEAVKYDGLSLKYINNQTEKICLQAISENPLAIKYVKDEMIKKYLKVIIKNSSYEPKFI